MKVSCQKQANSSQTTFHGPLLIWPAMASRSMALEQTRDTGHGIRDMIDHPPLAHDATATTPPL